MGWWASRQYRLTAVLAVAVSIPPYAHAQKLPALPQAWVDTSYPSLGGSTINVGGGGDLQNALNTANPGDTIKIQAGATFVGPFTLPVKSGSSWIIVRTSAPDVNLPVPGRRIDPSYAAQMPKIVTPDSGPAILTAAGAHHYRLVGLEITTDVGVTSNYGLVALGDDLQTSLSQVPSFLILDRVYIHGQPTANMRRGVALNSASSAVVDSYIAEAHEVGADAQAIAGWNGPGPFKITDNYLEGAGENMLFGGSDPSIPNLVPSDIEVRRNYFYKQLQWKSDDPSYAMIAWTVKNLFELKNAQRVLIDGNIFEHNWPAAQNGFSILFTVRNQDGTAPWSIVQDVTFTHNVVRNVSSAVNILGTDDLHPSQQTNRILVRDNVFDDVNATNWGGSGRLFQILDGTADITIDHNTAFQTGEVIAASGTANTGFTYRNNLTPNNLYGVAGDNFYGDPLGALTTYFPGVIFRRNVLQGGDALKYPADNFFPATMAIVAFVDQAGGNYRLAALSPYKNAGTDGKDVGADIDALEAATQAPIDTPSMFVATATSTSQVGVSWLPVSGATSYEVYRATSISGPYALAVTTSAVSATDGGRSANTTYLYKVRALGLGGSSAFSPIDPATTVMFTDASLAGVVIKATHITELRTAVNAMRAAAGLSSTTFTDGSLPGVIIRSAHIAELRTSLDEARTTIGISALRYTDPALTAGVTTVRAAHILEPRGGTQ